jgi:two-component system, chemotaxis family, sensor kinase CheA
VDVRQYADLFHSESRDHLTAYNQLLLEWEKAPTAREPVGGIFRAVHTIKGMAATMGYAGVAELAHRIESLLDVLRRGEKDPAPAVLDLLFRSGDALEKAIGQAVDGKAAKPPAKLLAELEKAVGGAAALPQRASTDVLAAPVSGTGRLVRLTLRQESSLKGARALLVLRKAEGLGAVSGLTPAAAALEADTFDGRFAFRLDTDADAERIEQALREAGDVDTVEVQEEQAEAGRVDPSRARHIRVDLRRLDALMNQIGELAIARGRLGTLTAGRDDPELEDVAVQMGRLTAALQGEIVNARMTPVWQVFDRFPRMVRDLARQTDKQVDFQVEGKEIELDRAILDEIADPLVHLLRNAVDHGIEPPEERRAKGKPAAGRLVLAAIRERSSVAIKVSDDGRGVSRARVLAKAKETGLVAQGIDALPDEELFRLLMRSGFSTAKQVTDVSGRGVGIDVVATATRALGGSLEIRTDEGKGTTFTIRLPVTLAIVRALLARVGAETYAMPLTHVAETVDPPAEEIRRVQGKEAILLRGKLVPLVRLTELLGVTASGPVLRRIPVIVLEVGERRSGVVVDALVGQQEIVVKGFDAPKGTLPIFSGATILGDGRPALILDAGGLT